MELFARFQKLDIDFEAILTHGEEKLRSDHGCGTVWIPPACVGDAFSTENDAKQMLLHYGYDLSRAWSVRRMSFSRNGNRAKKIGSLSVKLIRVAEEIPADRFSVSSAGVRISVMNPVTGKEHILTVHKYENDALDHERFNSAPDTEYPLHYTAMVYTLYPELERSAFFLRDHHHGDSPKRKSAGGAIGGAVGVIGMMQKGEEEEYFHPDGPKATPHVICSSLHFAPQDHVEWRMFFRQKMVEDIEITL